jgi:hypothetical protein
MLLSFRVIVIDLPALERKILASKLRNVEKLKVNISILFHNQNCIEKSDSLILVYLSLDSYNTWPHRTNKEKARKMLNYPFYLSLVCIKPLKRR